MSRLAYELLAFVFALFFLFLCMLMAEGLGLDWRNVAILAIVAKLMREDVWRLFK